MSGTGRVVLRWRAGASTDAGPHRSRNEDRFLLSDSVVAVADGMGGHDDGSAAAQALVDALRTVGDVGWVDPTRLAAVMASAAADVQRLAAGATRSAPGSTLTGVARVQQDGLPCWLVFNVGDSRTYRLLNGTLEQVTIDHTRVQELVDAGELHPDEARSHGERNVITRAFGAGTRGAPRVDHFLLVAGPEDRFLLCSDGLTGELSEPLIAATLQQVPDPQEAAETLVRLAVEAGGRDNVTAVVMDVCELAGAPTVLENGTEDGDTCPVLPHAADVARGDGRG